MEEKILRRWSDSPEIRKIDEESRTVEFVASDNSVDSYGTVIPVDKWDLTRFQNNGIIGYMHDVYGDSWTKSADPDDVIGKGEAWVEDDKLIVRITFEPADLNPKSDKIFRKLEFGSLHAVSWASVPRRRATWATRSVARIPRSTTTTARSSWRCPSSTSLPMPTP